MLRGVGGVSKPIGEESSSKPVQEGVESVNMHTGPVRVADSQGNIVHGVKPGVASSAKPVGEDAIISSEPRLGDPSVWWRGPGWKSSQALKPSRGPGLGEQEMSSGQACDALEDDASLCDNSKASLGGKECKSDRE